MEEIVHLINKISFQQLAVGKTSILNSCHHSPAAVQRRTEETFNITGSNFSGAACEPQDMGWVVMQIFIAAHSGHRSVVFIVFDSNMGESIIQL